MHVGIIGLQHESNTFLRTPTTLASFEAGHLLAGDSVRDAYQAAHHEIGGFFAALAERKIEAVPIFAAWALPSGTITDPTCDELLARLWKAMDEAGQIDGLLVAPHGAAVGELERDFDGHWLTQLRNRVGPRVPIVGTLDPHANVSHRMVEACDALVAYRSNPHLDQRARGMEAAELLVRTLEGEIRPTMAACLPPLAINIERQCTSASPCRELYELADRQRLDPRVLGNSVLLGFPYADVAEMGSGYLVVTNDDRQLAQSLADDLGQYLWQHREEFVGQLLSIEDAMRVVAAEQGPIGLLDMGDNVGGGSPADGTFLLAALIEAGVPRSFACLFDPQAVDQAQRAGPGAKLDLALGGKTDDEHGPTLRQRVKVISLHDGKFSETQARHGGQSQYDMGPTALVRLEGGQTVLLTSRRMAPFSLGQLTSCGVKPEVFQAIVIKGVHAPLAAYQPVCRRLIRVDTPGVTRADMAKLAFQHRRRPMFPFERPTGDGLP